MIYSLFSTIRLRLSCLILVSLVSLTQCKDDDKEIDDGRIDPANPTAVTKALKIPNSTLKAGNLPAPSADPNAPELEEESSNAILMPGSTLIIEAPIIAGDAVGFYVQVKGANEYFDINSIAYSGGRIGGRRKQGRTKETELAVFSIQAPDNLKPGEFCILYAIYDVKFKVSNIIEVCITVKEAGGANSTFLTNNVWQLVSTTFVEGDISTDFVGETYTAGKFTEILFCETDEVSVSVVEKYRTDYMYVTFLPGGKLKIEGKDYHRRFNYEQSEASCQVVYNEENIVYDFDGFWSYEEGSNKLTLLYTEVLDDNGVKEIDTEIEQYTVSHSGSTLKLTFIIPQEEIEEGEDEYFIMNFNSK
jgi:hypothetical protein